MSVGGRERLKCESRAPTVGGQDAGDRAARGTQRERQRETQCAGGVWAAVEQGPSDPALCSQVFGVHLNKWQLDRKLGCGCLFLYGVFLCFSIMTEFNVFTFVNLPMCGDH